MSLPQGRLPGPGFLPLRAGSGFVCRLGENLLLRRHLGNCDRFVVEQIRGGRSSSSLFDRRHGRRLGGQLELLPLRIKEDVPPLIAVDLLSPAFDEIIELDRLGCFIAPAPK